jgi:hypothetical protein
MGHDQRTEMRDLHRPVGTFVMHVRHAEQDQRRARTRLPIAFQCRDLRRLVLERVQPMLVADQNLDRCHHDSHPHGHGEHQWRRLVLRIAQQMECTDRPHHERDRQI